MVGWEWRKNCFMIFFASPLVLHGINLYHCHCLCGGHQSGLYGILYIMAFWLGLAGMGGISFF